MLHDDGIKSLEESASPEDHHTANLIDSIWEHDLGEDHLGEHRIERHHPSLKIKNYFGSSHHASVMLPTETLDGIDTHWTGHLPHVHSSEYCKRIELVHPFTRSFINQPLNYGL